MMVQKKLCRGFSLVELSVVLTIIGITLAGALDLATRKTESDRITETNTRMTAIEKALIEFVINNQRFPCPADPTLPLSNASSGKEGTPSTSGCSGANLLNNSANIYSGTIPSKTLNLTDKYMADDWDRRFTYVIDFRFANNLTTNALCDGGAAANHTVCFKHTSAGGITINDSTGATITTEAVYTIISHGKNGYGAWKYTGSATRLTASTDTDEKENAGTDRTIATAGFNEIFVQKESTTTFDDITRYSTKALIIDSAGGVTDSTTCTAAIDSLPQTGTGTDPCVGASSTVKCYALGARVNNLCLQP